ncbi:MAG: hypothetical protein QGF28_00125 [Candidatus Thalassarchaeaceae archaeon]|nr:hypothetical protein [Euryarchaeota archaeon]MDP6220166.1 hypothetical protein [Candidatus Thalassarchaeaceae archaeon]MBV43591.1 hypothetical protein [Euryarchaeota archaeon]MDP7091599.1 hypothetical protein [Candidatus Thalassarchaeaceae archaeon]MDP7257719.1 hypothetical protein [Candidatus Thalassarchaeaceae archaeon]
MTGRGLSDNRSLNRRMDSLARERESIRRLLDQSDLSTIREGLESLKSRLDAIEKRLSGL